MSERFRFAAHQTEPGKVVVEYWRDGKFVATIYPHSDGLRIISKYMTGVVEELDSPGSVVIKLEGDR